MTYIAAIRRGRAFAAAAITAITATVTAAALLASTASAATTPWTVVPSADAGTAADNVLHGVAMLGASDGFAVGGFAPSGSGIQATIQRWNGTAWTLMPTPSPDFFDVLNGVAALSPTDVWAVGGAESTAGAAQTTLIEHYDGTAWTIVPSPNTGVSNRLNAVAARAADDVWAVGQDGVNESQPIIEHWNGTAWSVVTGAALPAGATALLTGVTTTPDGAVWAVGAVQTPVKPEGVSRRAYIERLLGGTWQSLPVPATTAGLNVTLNAVSAASATDVWAVGALGGHPLAEHWDGTSVSIVPTPAISGASVVLKGVTAVAAHDAWFVGDQSLATVSMRSDGTTTTVQPTPTGSSRGDLTAVTSVGTTLFAVGSQTGAAGTASRNLALTDPNG
ncbi:hypothetical protein [Catenulispora yoronensis]